MYKDIKYYLRTVFMLHKFILSIILVFSCVVTSTSQSMNSTIEIIEQKRGKLTDLYAQNKTEDTLNIFFLVHAKGYRKSASKPIITNIPPFSSIRLTTLIELTSEPSSYTYDLVINGNATDTSFDYEDLPKDIEKIINRKIVLFTGINCEKCTELITALDENKVRYEVIDINEKPVYYRQFIAHIQSELTVNTRIRLPLIWNKDHVIFGYDDLNDILGYLE